MDHLLITRGGFTYIPNSNGGVKEESFHHLTCFAGGMLATGALTNRKGNWTLHLHAASQVTESCVKGIQSSATGLGGEVFRVSGGNITAEGEYILRFELLTKTRNYRESILHVAVHT